MQVVAIVSDEGHISPIMNLSSSLEVMSTLLKGVEAFAKILAAPDECTDVLGM